MYAYCFCLMSREGDIVGAVDRTFHDDDDAVQHAQSFLLACPCVEVFRGTSLIGSVARKGPTRVARSSARRRKGFARGSAGH